MSNISKAISNFVNTVNCVEMRSHIHQLGDSMLKVVEIAKGVLPTAGRLFKEAMTSVNGLFGVLDFLDCGKYFFYKVPPESTEPRFGKDADGNFYVKKKNYDTTQFTFHAQEGKFLKIASKVGALFAGIGSVATFLDQIGIFKLAEWSSKLSTLGPVGNAISQIVHPIFFSGLLTVGGIILFSALTIDSIIYLAKAAHDPEKSVLKGLLDLAARVAGLATCVLLVAGITQPYILIPLAVGGALFGIAGIVHRQFREAHKAELQLQHKQALGVLV